MTLLLVNPPGIRPWRRGVSFFDDQKRNLRPDQYRSMPMEHLGLMSITASARSRGMPVASVNGLVDGHRSVDETWQAMQDEARASGPPTLVGFSIIDTLAEVIDLAGRVRRQWPDAATALGNTMASLNYERVLDQHDCFDYVVVGDGESSAVELTEALSNGRSAAEVPGVASRKRDGTVTLVPPRIEDLDGLPSPARDETPKVLAAGFAAAVNSTRGCPYRCTFCGTGAVSELLGRQSYRTRSVDRVVDEIEYLVVEFGVEFVAVTDDLFVSKHPSMQVRAMEFADALIRRRLGITFMIDVRLDSVSDLSLYDRLREAGLRRVFVGVETGSYEQLIAYRKRSVRRSEDPATKIRALQDRGIEVIPGTIMFHPTVRPAELRETSRVLRAIDYKTPRKFLDRVTAYPGTPLHADYAARGLLVTDWPIGTWHFEDPEAANVYDDVYARIDSDPDISYDDAERYFLERVATWESAGSDQPVTIPAMSSARRAVN